MKRKRTYTNYLLDILDNAEKAERFVAGIDQSAFEANLVRQRGTFPNPCGSVMLR